MLVLRMCYKDVQSNNKFIIRSSKGAVSFFFLILAGRSWIIFMYVDVKFYLFFSFVESLQEWCNKASVSHGEM